VLNLGKGCTKKINYIRNQNQKKDMSTARILYEQYKVLPKRIRQELKTLINKDEDIKEPKQAKKKLLLKEIEESLLEVKMMQNGSIPKRSFSDLLTELENAK
jgi:flagellar motility protein MotE (MotC chaperone)